MIQFFKEKLIALFQKCIQSTNYASSSVKVI